MDKLLNPDPGLLIWTVVTFLTLVFLLKKLAWGPLLTTIEERESRMRSDLEKTQAARAEAERIKSEFEAELAGIQAKSRELLAQAGKEGEALRARLKAAAESDAYKIREKTMVELADEKERLIYDLRREVANLSVLAAERLMRKSVDEQVHKSVLDAFFKDLDAQRRRP
jgi:F-type H+-transporting ATPase subunit b